MLPSLEPLSPVHRVSFSEVEYVHFTFSSLEYDRRNDFYISPLKRPLAERKKILAELEHYLNNEMAVHPQARAFKKRKVD